MFAVINTSGAFALLLSPDIKVLNVTES